MKKMINILMLVVVTTALSFAVVGCQAHGEHPSSEHPTSEHAASEHEHPKAEHPKSEHPE